MIFHSKSCSERVSLRVTGSCARVRKPLGRASWAFRRILPTFRSCFCLRFESLQSNQVIRRPDEGKQPADFLSAPQLHLSQQADHLHPTETLFHSFPFLLTDRIARVPCRAPVNRARPVGGVLRHMGRDVYPSQLTNEVARVVILVSSQGESLAARHLLGHL